MDPRIKTYRHEPHNAECSYQALSFHDPDSNNHQVPPGESSEQNTATTIPHQVTSCLDHHQQTSSDTTTTNHNQFPQAITQHNHQQTSPVTYETQQDTTTTNHNQFPQAITQHNHQQTSHLQHDHHHQSATIQPMQLWERFEALNFPRFDVAHEGHGTSNNLSHARFSGKTLFLGQLPYWAMDPTVVVRIFNHFVPGGIAGKVHVRTGGGKGYWARVTFSNQGDVDKVRRLNNRIVFTETSAYLAETNEQVGILQTYMNGERRHERASIDLPMQPMSVTDAHNKRPSDDSTCPPARRRVTDNIARFYAMSSQYTTYWY